MNFIARAILSSAFAILAGCATTGNGRALSVKPGETSPLLQIGKTSKSDVEREFGSATVYRFGNSYETWVYQETVGVPKFVSFIPIIGLITPAWDDRTFELALLFDPQGTLRNADWRGRPKQQ